MINNSYLHNFAQSQLQQAEIVVQKDDAAAKTKVSAEIQMNGRSVLITLIYNTSSFKEENVQPHLLQAIMKAEGLGKVYDLGGKTKSLRLNAHNELSIHMMDGRDKEKGDVNRALVDKKVKLLTKLDHLDEEQQEDAGTVKAAESLSKNIELINHCLRDCLPDALPRTKGTEPSTQGGSVSASSPESLIIEAKESAPKSPLKGRLSLFESLKEKAYFVAESTRRFAVRAFENTKAAFFKVVLAITDPEARQLEAVKAMNQSADTISGGALIYDEGKRIEKVWDDGEGHAATETIDRRDTVKTLRKQSLQELKYVVSRLKKEELKPEEREKLEMRKARLLDIIQRCDSSSVDWANSDYFRDILRGDPLLSSKENPQGLEGAILHYERVIEREYLAMAPAVNMRYHSCSAGEKKEGWLRSGIISDMSNGFVNLQSLQTLHKSLANDDVETASALRREMALEIIGFWQDAVTSKKVNADASAGYALRELGYPMETIQEIKRALDLARPVDRRLLALAQDDVPGLRERLDRTIEKRTQVMQGQFLQLVTDHAARLTEEDVQGGMMKMLHVSLLSQRSKKIDGSGWFHNEENEILDMATLYEQFDGKKMIADPKGPFIDKDGNIHLPPSDAFPLGKEIVLRSIFISQSVQGGTRNNKVQGAINERAYAKLDSLDLEGKREMKKILHAKRSDYTSAADMVSLALQAGFKTSTGCLSAKDRTGFVSALMTERVMKRNGFPPSLRRRILREQLGPNSPAVLVIKDNTGTAIMKIKPFMIEGITKGTFSPKGWATRAAVYVRQGVEILLERRRIKQFEKAGKQNAGQAPAA